MPMDELVPALTFIIRLANLVLAGYLVSILAPIYRADRNASFSAPTVTASYDYAGGPDGMVTSPQGSSYIVIDPSKGSALNISNVGGTIKIEKG